MSDASSSFGMTKPGLFSIHRTGAGPRYLLTLMMSVVAFPAHPAEWHVPRDLSTIQAAVDPASPGDTILIAPGVYREHVTVTVTHLKVVGTGTTNSEVSLVSDLNYYASGEDGEPVHKGALALWAKVDISLSNLTIKNVFDEPAAKAKGLRGPYTCSSI